MRYLLLGAALLCASTFLTAQATLNADQYEQSVLDYQIPTSAEYSEQTTLYAQRILDEIRSATEGKIANFSEGDYFNALSVFLTLELPQVDLELAFERFLNAENSCEYLQHLKEDAETNKKYAPIRSQWMAALKNCETTTPDQPAEAETALQKQLKQILADDQRHRGKNKNLKQQKTLDERNQERIDKLYAQYGTYLGKELVGKEYRHVMWSVVQHSNPAYMQKYFSVLQQAYQAGQLDKGLFKLFLDRYHGLHYGFQIFGTQQGFDWELADEDTKKRIEAYYKL